MLLTTHPIIRVFYQITAATKSTLNTLTQKIFSRSIPIESFKVFSKSTKYSFKTKYENLLKIKNYQVF